ncbi:MAG: ATP-dependent helicase [Acholeplasmataceae bacterium]|jgi:DNA helicase-2/ATP-dependent DNA helicase PcrA|nr:ATP-dependent helicase [Acholeplasmataceae bacterium]
MILNDEQRKVIESNDRFLFLLAGAGSGKTRVIVEKIKSLLVKGVLPNEILAITFTRKSAFEMKERVNNTDVHIHTFHQFCLQQLIKNSSYDSNIIDESNIPFSKDDVLKISRYKNSLYRTTKPKSFLSYQAYMKNHRLKDFDDFLLDFIEMVKERRYVSPYKYVFIDEFQDTNLLQYEVLKMLIQKDTRVLAVGDPDQSIYQFRGAHSKIISFYVKDYQASVYTLSINYRCSPEIITYANKLIERNNRKFKKKLITYNESMSEPILLNHDNETQESIYLIKEIEHYHQKGIKLSDIAVLYRTHYRAYELKYQLDLIDFPYEKEHKTQTRQGIHLLTIHQAKGLEFEIVIIIGLEKNVLPSTHDSTQVEQDEERRLMFVAMTRAKKQLILSYVKLNSSNILQKPSIFIKECGLKNQKTK